MDGKLVKIVNGSVAKQIALLNVENITCGTIANEKICGRPLGLRRLNAQFLLVADAYHGLFKGCLILKLIFLVDKTLVDIENNTVENIFSSNEEINGQTPLFINDVDLVNESIAFVSDSSVRWQRRQFIYLVMENKGHILRIQSNKQ